MWRRQLGALIAKDLRLHGWPMLGAAAGTLLLLATVTRYLPQSAGPRAILAVQLNFLFALISSDWLVARERTTGTIAWLRTLPVDDAVVVGSKFLLGATWCLLLWALTTAGFAPELWRPASTGLALAAGLLAWNAVCIAARWRFPWRVAFVGPVVLVGVPLALLARVAPAGSTARTALVELWIAPAGRPLVALALLTLHGLVVAVTTAWVRRVETSRLLD